MCQCTGACKSCSCAKAKKLCTKECTCSHKKCSRHVLSQQEDSTKEDLDDEVEQAESNEPNESDGDASEKSPESCQVCGLFPTIRDGAAFCTTLCPLNNSVFKILALELIIHRIKQKKTSTCKIQTEQNKVGWAKQSRKKNMYRER